MAKRAPGDQEGTDGKKNATWSIGHEVARRALIASGRKVAKKVPADQKGADWELGIERLRERRLTRRVQSGRKGTGREGVDGGKVAKWS